MPRVSFNLDPDVALALEQYRSTNCPNATLHDAAHELVRAALAQVPTDGVLDAVRAQVRQAEVKWLHGKLQGFLSDLNEESQRRGGGD